MLRFSARIVIFLCAVSGGSVWAHPGAGIVVNSQGRIYFVLYGPVNRIMTVNDDGKIVKFVSHPKLRAPHHLALDSAELA